MTYVGRPTACAATKRSLAPIGTRIYHGNMMTILESIVRDLRELPAPKLVEVSNYIHALHPSTDNAKRRRDAIRGTAGCMAGEDGEDFERAVRETADRIDADE